jgi:ABC-type lipoprotein export system ATPase subunit
MIRLQGVSKTYGTTLVATPVLRSVSVHVERGEYVALVGRSGSGKSTLLNIMGCLDRADSGEVVIGGQDIASSGEQALATLRCRRIGFVFQAFHLIPLLSTLQNVEQPMLYAGIERGARRERAMALLGEMRLEGRAHHRPPQLSGGEQQRAAIARALANDPDILIADEPTGSLDSASADEVMAIFDDLHRRGKTIILVTHDASVAARCGRIVRIEDGRIGMSPRVAC